MYKKLFWVLLLWSTCAVLLFSQDPLRFEGEIEQLIHKEDIPDGTEIYLFTGSSSVRLWKTLKQDFEGYPVLNRGFGGSQMSDLLYFKNELIIQYHPAKVFIYEGDNDIWAGKTVDEIMKDTKELVSAIHDQLPVTMIYFISAKPSVARWKRAATYIEFNGVLKDWTQNKEQVTFVDVWTPMCLENGQVKKDLFLFDKLHMNEKGYKIWTDAIRPFVEE